MRTRRSPKEERLKGALWFSALCVVAVPLVSRGLRVAPEQDRLALSYFVVALGLALASVFASWLLVAALLERRPALRDPRGRLAWYWTLAFCAVFLALGLLNRTSHTIGAAVLVASGWLVALVGGIGLALSAAPPREPRTAERQQ